MSRTSSQDVKSRAKAGATQAKAQAMQAKAQAIRVQGRAVAAKEQFTPLAKSVQLTASQGVRQARTWAAPRVEQAGVAVQERIAPKVSSAMIATARKMQPDKDRRPLWPAILAGIVTASAAAVAALLFKSQRDKQASSEPDTGTPPASAASANGMPASSNEQSETSDVNGQVRTP